jgi:hypothetical protein
VDYRLSASRGVRPQVSLRASRQRPFLDRTLGLLKASAPPGAFFFSRRLWSGWSANRRARVAGIADGAQDARRLTSSRRDVTWFRARLRVARCEVRYNRKEVLLVEICHSLGHQRAPFSRAGAVLELIELPEHVAR